ncbi:MAG: hypothetical protein ACYDAR_12870 [Thermomicrobiales bacterium]
MQRRDHRWTASALLFVVLLVACGGGGSSAALSPVPTGAGVALTTALPATARMQDKVDGVFLRLLIVYQTQGPDAARQFARDQALMTSTDDVRVTLVLDSDDPTVVDGTALAIGRLGGRVTETFGNQIELVVPIQTAMESGKVANTRSFFAGLADFAHVRGIDRTPLAQLTTARAPIQSSAS